MNATTFRDLGPGARPCGWRGRSHRTAGQNDRRRAGPAPDPYVIAHADEVAPRPLRFTRCPLGGLRLAYEDPRRGDMAHGVLRVRVLNSRRGAPQWRRLNTLRRWRCMEKPLCFPEHWPHS
ncbi:hypothetical protein [Streptosporangium sp. V21-05]|uniref:hypothetical protein n=1 Tax=Streptosporangium sp. V21-05 TaxID=3446115 RepID=UPI003F53AC59